MMILVSHIRYRRAVVAGRLPASSFPAPGGTVCSWIAVGFLLLVTAMIAIDPDSRISLYVGAGWAICLAIGWAVLKSRNPQIAARAAGTDREPEPAGRS